MTVKKTKKQCCERDHNFDGNCDRHPVWIITAKSESGDSYGPKRYDHEPTIHDLRDFILEEASEDIDVGGPGDFNSYVYLKVDKL